VRVDCSGLVGAHYLRDSCILMSSTRFPLPILKRHPGHIYGGGAHDLEEMDCMIVEQEDGAIIT